MSGPIAALWERLNYSFYKNREPPVFRPGALFDLTLRFLEFRLWLSTFVVGRSSSSEWV